MIQFYLLVEIKSLIKYNEEKSHEFKLRTYIYRHLRTMYAVCLKFFLSLVSSTDEIK